MQFEESWRRKNYPWSGKDAFEIATSVGVTSNLELVLDVGDSTSYTGGQSWADLSGNGYNFYRGATSAAQASDPTFNGTAGNLSSSEYWSFDGGDYFTYDSANETWMNNLHKDNASFTILMTFYGASIGSTQILCGTNAGSGAEPGFIIYLESTSDVRFFCCNDSEIVGVAASALVPNGSAWNILSLTIDEGNSDGRIFLNGSTYSYDGSYHFATPTTNNAFTTMQIAAGGLGGSPVYSGTRMGVFMAWSNALSSAQNANICDAIRGRYGI